MNITIVVFSPQGNTYKVAKELSKQLSIKENSVNIVNLTGNKNYFSSNNIDDFYKDFIRPHDVLCIGGPVYAHRMPDPLLDFIENLPKPGNKWSKYVVPFVTYGNISSGIALLDAAELLQKTGRINVCGMKINAFHCYSRKFKKKINEGMPGKEEEKYIAELAVEISNLATKSKKTDISYKFSCKTEEEKMISKKRRDNVVFPKIEFDYNNCKKCGACEKICPVLNIKIREHGPEIINQDNCISCSECFHVCRNNAIIFDVLKFEEKLTLISEGKDLNVKPENPKSQIFC